MKSANRIPQAIETVVRSMPRLQSLRMPDSLDQTMLDLACIAAFREILGDQRPTLVGFIGCTGTGKSTLFNSLCGRAACITGWKAHNTAGPVLLSSVPFYQTLEQVQQRIAPFFLPRWQPETLPLREANSQAGKPGVLQWLISEDSIWKNTVLIDLPDINTTRAIQDNLLTLTLLPWLDTTIFVVDEETLFHRDYEEPVRLSKSFQQRRLCILNNRGRDRVDLNHPDLLDVKKFFGVDTLHVLPELKGKNTFDRETEYLRFRDDLFLSSNKTACRPLYQSIAPVAQRMVMENQRRERMFQDLEERLQSEIKNRLSAEQPIPIHRLLNEETRQVLEHLGLQRFALSNIVQFFKRVTRTGSITRSFQLAFGNRRDGAVEHMLHLDFQKLQDEVSARIADHREAIQQCIHQHPDARLLGGLTKMPTIDLQEPIQQLQSILHEFEQKCRELILSDTLSSTIKNDPFTSAALSLVFIADLWTIPGFGSWVLAPSLVHYLPVGQFDGQKRQFQRRVREWVREILTRDLHYLQEARKDIVLEENDPLGKALKVLADYDENR